MKPRHLGMATGVAALGLSSLVGSHILRLTERIPNTIEHFALGSTRAYFVQEGNEYLYTQKQPDGKSLLCNTRDGVKTPYAMSLEYVEIKPDSKRWNKYRTKCESAIVMIDLARSQ